MVHAASSTTVEYLNRGMSVFNTGNGMMVSWRYLASDAEDTEYRITTLMQNPQYHNQVVGQNIAYNQPPHASFYLGSDKSLPARPNVTVLGGNRYTPVEEEKVAASLTENGLYMIKNASSGLYMEVANGEAKNGADGAAAHNTWKVQSAAPSDYATALKWLSFFIRPLFESALKTNDVLEFAIVTGCLRISMYFGLNGISDTWSANFISRQYLSCFFRNKKYYSYTDRDCN